MNAKPMVPSSLYLASGLLGGITGVILTILWHVAVDLILDPGQVTRPLAFVFAVASTDSWLFWPVIVPVALLSTILAVLLARKLISKEPLPLAILLAGCSAGLVGSFAAALWSFCLVIFSIMSI